ncbi:MAG: glucan ABC transporter ATP-binding protein/ permease [Acetobacteraceae bacterium]|nr:glucan ABC transporter ATP-binding protein/ permease [Acetobacteraceae bacterium]
MSFIRTYLRVLGALRPNLWTAVALVVANLLVAGLHFVDPLLFGRVIEMLTQAGTMAPEALWREAATLLGLWAAIGALGILANIVASVHAERLAHRHRLAAMNRYFGHVLTLPPEFHGDAHSGRLVKVMIGGADAMFGLWLSFFRDHLSTFVSALVLLPLTALLNWRLALLLMALAALFCVLTVLVILRTEEGQRRAQRFQIQLAGTAQDALANVTVMQSFTRLAAEQTMFRQIIQQVIAHQFPVLNWWALVNVMTKAASTITVIAIVVTGTVLHVRGQASVGEIVSFMGFATLLIGRLDGAMVFCAQLFQEAASLREFFAVLDAQSTVVEKPGAADLVVNAGEVTFEDVAFAYPKGGMVLDGVDFTAAPGSVVALVGHTGAGKSTAMALLQRMWDPQHGRISIDGQDLRDVSLESLRRNIGVVFQEAMLLNRTIRENLLIGKPDASQAELDAACVVADAQEFILRQHDGYDTMVGERGASLSGGQRQRLAIARALLKDPPILVLDEATSALDAATEARVAAALRRLMTGRTTFIIAHRLSTVRDADEILVFDGGRIVERGGFDALVARRGRFAELVATQLSPAL